MKKILVGVGIVVLDQVSKFIVLKYWPNIISQNNGGAFSILQGYRYYGIAVLTLTVFLVLAVIFYKNARTWPILLIIAGAFSNLIDRLLRSSVVDFLDFKIWPSFNLADVAISVGLIWIIVGLLIPTKKPL